MFKHFYRSFSLLLALVVCINVLSIPAYAKTGISWEEGGVWGKVVSWLAGSQGYDMLMGTDHSGKYAVNTPQKYYTTPTSSVQDKYGNVTNYYRSGDTTNTKIIDSYNKTFNTIHNTNNTSTTNNYKANIKLSDFLNSYTTNNVTNNNTYSANFKSWYYDNTTNNYNYTTFNKNDYTQNNLYYNQDNSRYYISIDNSTDEYYLIDVQYSPTFVTVNYTYNTTNINNKEEVGDVTNVYYYELKDGRNSSTLSAAEVAGLDFGYDVANYELVADDPNTLSLQHFDGDYNDSSVYGRSFYSQNRSTTYVDSGAFGKAVSLPNGSAAGVTIPGLSGHNSLSFDFRVYYNDISSLGIYFGDTNIFQQVPTTERVWTGRDTYSDNGNQLRCMASSTGNVASLLHVNQKLAINNSYTIGYISSILSEDFPAKLVPLSNTFKSQMTAPTAYNSPGYVGEGTEAKKYGWMPYPAALPVLVNSTTTESGFCDYQDSYFNPYCKGYNTRFFIRHYTDKEYRWSPSQYVLADFSYDSYRNQWVSMRITLSGGNIYYFVNGDLVGSGPFSKPSADKFYIKSSGSVYLDELRVTTGNLSSTAPYNPSGAPFDTNKVLALPNTLRDKTIYVQHSTPAATCRVGGVRPSNPVNGFLYIPLQSDYTGGQPQFYVDGNWVNVNARVSDGKTTFDALGYKFAPIGSSPDVINPENCTHVWVEKDRIEPTCTASGSAKSACSKCSKTKEETLSSLGHDWQESSRTPATCTAAGSVTSACSRCQESKVTSLPALGGSHSWAETSRTDAACTVAGSFEETCSRCQDKKTTPLPALGHDWQETTRNPATCSAPGSIHSECSRCQETKTDEIPVAPNAHSWEETGRFEPTCVNTGSSEKTCSLCGETKVDTLLPLNHAWEETGRTPATCTVPGSATSTCSRCGQVQTVSIPTLGGSHSWLETSRTDATCSAPGSVEKICSICNTMETETLPILEHAWAQTGFVPATCVTSGFIVYTCSHCQEKKTDTLPQLSHVWKIKQTSQTTYDENGNILTEGFTIYSCELCGEEYKDTDGKGPPSPSVPDNPDKPGDGEGESLWDKLGKFLGSVLGGLLDLIGSVIGGILDGLITLVTTTFERLSQLVNLFGSFGDALGVLWTWLPPEIMSVLVAGVTVFVLIALLKLFLK